jgi:hypothetical protein
MKRVVIDRWFISLYDPFFAEPKKTGSESLPASIRKSPLIEHHFRGLLINISLCG